MTYETKYTQDMILGAMTDSPELPSKIAKRLGCHTRTVTRMLPQLEADGLVKRYEIGGNLSAWSKVI